MFDDIHQLGIMGFRDKVMNEEADLASKEAVKGGVMGALKWGAGAAVLGAIGYAMSPVYRATTIQFKV